MKGQPIKYIAIIESGTALIAYSPYFLVLLAHFSSLAILYGLLSDPG